MRTTINDPSRDRAYEIVANLPRPDYEQNFQPTYRDMVALVEGVHEVSTTTPVTTPAEIAKHKQLLATGRILAIGGSCHELINLFVPIENHVMPVIQFLGIVEQSDLPTNTMAVSRGRGQSTKPRTLGVERLKDGHVVTSFQGHAVNSDEADHRDPDPSRMVAMAVQARDVEQMLVDTLGEHVPAAHEMLLLPYEDAFTVTDPETGKLWLLSADSPWVGVRTNNPNGVHVERLSRIENTVGAKLGANTSEDMIGELATKLNPHHEDGKLILMPRVGPNNLESLRTMARGIRRHCRESKIVYDAHGVTFTDDQGNKIRNVKDVKRELTLGAEILASLGLQWDGIHLETTHKDWRLECIDEVGQTPTHPGEIDPRFNPRQTLEIFNHFATLL